MGVLARTIRSAPSWSAPSSPGLAVCDRVRSRIHPRSYHIWSFSMSLPPSAIAITLTAAGKNEVKSIKRLKDLVVYMANDVEAWSFPV